VRMSARKYAPPQLKFMRDKIRELEELGLVVKNTGAGERVLRSSFRSQGPTSIA
jgi:hypothetical protein